jgi:hypothetical protein
LALVHSTNFRDTDLRLFPHLVKASVPRASALQFLPHATLKSLSVTISKASTASILEPFRALTELSVFTSTSKLNVESTVIEKAAPFLGSTLASLHLSLQGDDTKIDLRGYSKLRRFTTLRRLHSACQFPPSLEELRGRRCHADLTKLPHLDSLCVEHLGDDSDAWEPLNIRRFVVVYSTHIDRLGAVVRKFPRLEELMVGFVDGTNGSDLAAVRGLRRFSGRFDDQTAPIMREWVERIPVVWGLKEDDLTSRFRVMLE